MTQGVEAIGLASTTVLLPSGITTKPVASLNHAYTKLSETFETWRISHGKVCLGTGLPFVHVVKGLVLFVDEFHSRVFLGILGARIDPLDVRAAAERSHEVVHVPLPTMHWASRSLHGHWAPQFPKSKHLG